MLKYARSDTHFLLYIYDNLRNALLDRSQSQSRAQSPLAGPSTPTSAPSTASGSGSGSRELLAEVLSRSADTTLRVYAKEAYDLNDGTGSGGWDTLAKKWNKGALLAGGPGVGVGAMQREVYKAVHWWRERVAREEDESTRYVFFSSFALALAVALEIVFGCPN
jgi:exosome complex exonuclease RRP6